MKKTLVIARYKEDISWLDQVTGCDIRIVQKELDVPNVGREALSYAWWMQQNHDKLPDGMIYFLQAGSPEHRPGIAQWLSEIEFEWPFYWIPGPGVWRTDGRKNPKFPDEDPLPIYELWEDLTGNSFECCTYVPHALFACSRQLIHRKPRADYAKLYDLLSGVYAVGSEPLNQTRFMQRGPWAMERLWERWMTL